MKVPLWLGLVIGGVLGFAFGILCAFPNLQYEPTVSFSDIVTAVITLITAVFIGYYLTRWSRHHRAEKERIIRKAEEVVRLVAVTRTAIIRFSSKAAEFPEVNAAFRDLSASVAHVANQLRIFEIKPATGVEKTESALSAYREAVQADPVSDENRRAFEARGRYEQRQLELQLEELIRDINRA